MCSISCLNSRVETEMTGFYESEVRTNIQKITFFIVYIFTIIEAEKMD